jgi:CDP-diacylglycerol--glycerol-3-phosphate 3-phosphatidyltransferase
LGETLVNCSNTRLGGDDDVANYITVSRLPVLIAIILLLGTPSPGARLAAAALVVLLIALDSIDGIVARKRGEISVMGSVLDIMMDRAVELVLWVWYAHLGLVPVGIPILYILRGTIVDSLRNIRVRDGQAPFETMRTRLGAWLVKSPIMRTGYALTKCIAFTGLAVTHALRAYATAGEASARSAQTVGLVFGLFSWLSVAFCLARGLPVIIENLPALFGPPTPHREAKS